jgi:hypothetical protein
MGAPWDLMPTRVNALMGTSKLSGGESLSGWNQEMELVSERCVWFFAE